MTERPLPRRLLLVAAAAPLLGVRLAGCANPAPAPRWYVMRPGLPPGVDAVPAAAVPAPVVQLLGVTVPEVLDRDTLLVAEGGSGVAQLTGHRWAEPLRDAVPRLLRADLALLLGDGRLWGVPLPAGVVPQRALRVELLSLLADPARNAVDLQARVAIAPAPVSVGVASGAASAVPAAAAPSATARTLRLSAPSTGPTADALAQAHRLVLWRLAEAVAALLRA